MKRVLLTVVMMMLIVRRKIKNFFILVLVVGEGVDEVGEVFPVSGGLGFLGVELVFEVTEVAGLEGGLDLLVSE